MAHDIAAVIVDTDCHTLAYNALFQSVSRFDVRQVIVYSDRPDAWPGYSVTPIAPLTSIADYNTLIIKRLAEDLRCAHALVLQFDGFILNPQEWAPLFQHYDYIGAPWPDDPAHPVGNGGFSLRSRRLVDTVARLDYPDATEAEDVFICRRMGDTLTAQGLHFAPRDVAAHFSVEFPPVRWPTFGFHGIFLLPDVYQNAPDYLVNNLSDRVIRQRANYLLPDLQRHAPAAAQALVARLQALQARAATLHPEH